jgi:hypothetical protein
MEAAELSPGEARMVSRMSVWMAELHVSLRRVATLVPSGQDRSGATGCG